MNIRHTRSKNCTSLTNPNQESHSILLNRRRFSLRRFIKITVPRAYCVRTKEKYSLIFEARREEKKKTPHTYMSSRRERERGFHVAKIHAHEWAKQVLIIKNFRKLLPLVGIRLVRLLFYIFLRLKCKLLLTTQFGVNRKFSLLLPCRESDRILDHFLFKNNIIP